MDTTVYDVIRVGNNVFVSVDELLISLYEIASNTKNIEREQAYKNVIEHLKNIRNKN